MKKILKFLVTLIIVLGIIIWMFKVNNIGTETIKEKLSPGDLIEISIDDYYNVKNNMLEKYFGFIISGEYEKAYHNLVKEYKNYKTLEQYTNEIRQINFENVVIKEIKLKNNNVYVANIEIDGTEYMYHIYVNDISNTYTISPDKFLDYYNEKLELKKWGFECIINNCLIEEDKITINMDINNKSGKEIEISDIYMISEDDYKYSMNNPQITLKSKENTNINITYNTNYTFPKSIKIKENDVGSGDYKYYEVEINH